MSFGIAKWDDIQNINSSSIEDDIHNLLILEKVNNESVPTLKKINIGNLNNSGFDSTFITDSLNAINNDIGIIDGILTNLGTSITQTNEKIEIEAHKNRYDILLQGLIEGVSNSTYVNEYGVLLDTYKIYDSNANFENYFLNGLSIQIPISPIKLSQSKVVYVESNNFIHVLRSSLISDFIPEIGMSYVISDYNLLQSSSFSVTADQILSRVTQIEQEFGEGGSLSILETLINQKADSITLSAINANIVGLSQNLTLLNSNFTLTADRISSQVSNINNGNSFTLIAQQTPEPPLLTDKLYLTGNFNIEFKAGDKFTIFSELTFTFYTVTLNEDYILNSNIFNIDPVELNIEAGSSVWFQSSYARSLINQTSENILLQVSELDNRKADLSSLLIEKDRITSFVGLFENSNKLTVTTTSLPIGVNNQLTVQSLPEKVNLGDILTLYNLEDGSVYNVTVSADAEENDTIIFIETTNFITGLPNLSKVYYTLSSKFSKISQTIDSITSSVADIDFSLAGIDDSLNLINGNISTITQTTTAIESKVGGIVNGQTLGLLSVNLSSGIINQIVLNTNINLLKDSLLTVLNVDTGVFDNFVVDDDVVNNNVIQVKSKTIVNNYVLNSHVLLVQESAYSSITQLDNSITSFVSSTNTLINDINGNITSIQNNYSTITQTDTSITSAVASLNTRIDDELNIINGSISAIDIKADGITSTVNSIIDGQKLGNAINNSSNTIVLDTNVTLYANSIISLFDSINNTITTYIISNSIENSVNIPVNQTVIPFDLNNTSVFLVQEEVHSVITQTNNSITSAVSSLQTNIDNTLLNYSTITQTDTSITSAVSVIDTRIDNEVNIINGSISAIDIKADGIISTVGSIVNGQKLSDLQFSLSGVITSITSNVNVTILKDSLITLLHTNQIDFVNIKVSQDVVNSVTIPIYSKTLSIEFPLNSSIILVQESSYSRITQLNNEIDLRVTQGDIESGFTINSLGVSLFGKTITIGEFDVTGSTISSFNSSIGGITIDSADRSFNILDTNSDWIFKIKPDASLPSTIPLFHQALSNQITYNSGTNSVPVFSYSLVDTTFQNTRPTELRFGLNNLSTNSFGNIKIKARKIGESVYDTIETISISLSQFAPKQDYSKVYDLSGFDNFRLEITVTNGSIRIEGHSNSDNHPILNTTNLTVRQYRPRTIINQDGIFTRSTPLTINSISGVPSALTLTSVPLEDIKWLDLKGNSVIDSTLITNLNADLWDGNQFNSYLNQSVKTTSDVIFNSIDTNGSININSKIALNDNGTINWGSSLSGSNRGILSWGFNLSAIMSYGKLQLSSSGIFSDDILITMDHLIGIGTDNPIHKLDVNGSIGISGNLIIDSNRNANFNSIDVNSKIALNDNGTINWGSSLSGSNRGLLTWTTNLSMIISYSGLRLSSSGSSNNDILITMGHLIGIGTNNPIHKLDVLGSIRATERVYIGIGGGYFYNDVGSRITSNNDLLIDNINTYIYGDNTYLGNNGDNIRLRNNIIFGDNWSINPTGGAEFVRLNTDSIRILNNEISNTVDEDLLINQMVSSSKSLILSSYGNIKINMDSNNNDTNKYFGVYKDSDSLPLFKISEDKTLQHEGGGHFKGWINNNSSSGIGLDIGIISDEGYILAYDRTNINYRNLNLTSKGGSSNLKLLTDGGILQSNYTSSSNGFASGFAGFGTKLDFLTNSLSLNELTVRGRMRVYELLINQIRATNGSLWVSSSTKVKQVSFISGSTYRCFIEDNQFVPFLLNDLLRAQRFTGSGIYLVEGRVITVNNGNSTVTNNSIARYFDLVLESGSDIPTDGIDLVRIGNSIDLDRQGAVYITADDEGSPFIDIVDEINSFNSFQNNKSFKARLGKLQGIIDPNFGQLNGYGLYTQNLYATGNTQISGTLTAGDENGVGNTFYAGRIRKNLLKDLSNPNTIGNNTTFTSGISDPFEGMNGFILSNINSTNSETYIFWSTEISELTNYTISLWVKTNGQNATLFLQTSLGNIEIGGGGGVIFLGQTNEWKRVTHTFTVTAINTGRIKLDLGINETLFIAGLQVEKGNRATSYQPTNGIISNDNGFGMWAIKGGFGGTIQNPIVKLENYGLKINYTNSSDTVNLLSNSIMIGNIIGSASGAIKLTNTSINSTSGLFGYNNLGDETFALRLNGTSHIAGWSFDKNTLFKTSKIYLDSSGVNGSLYLGGSSYSNSKIGLSGDGSGKLANGNIIWDTNGIVTLDPSVTINYSSINDRIITYRYKGYGFNLAFDGYLLTDDNVNLQQPYGHNPRSYMVYVFNRSNNVLISSTKYDVFGSSTNALNMANDLNALDSTKYVIITGQHAPDQNRLTNGLPNAIYRCGGTTIGFTDWSGWHTYFLIGIPSLGEGTGIENRSKPGVILYTAVSVYKGDIIGASKNTTPSYITSTRITSTTVESPIISGNQGLFSGYIKAGNTKIGVGVISGKNGIIQNNGDYWYDDNSFRLGGTSGISYNGGNVTIGSNVNVLGNITGASGTFSGAIIASSGTVGGWNIQSDRLYKNFGSGYMEMKGNSGTHRFLITPDGDLSGATGNFSQLYYISDSNWGISGSKNGKLLFQLGYINQIAGWEFNENSIFGFSGGLYTGMQVPKNSSTKTFFAGGTTSTGSNAKFWVLPNGKMGHPAVGTVIYNKQKEATSGNNDNVTSISDSNWYSSSASGSGTGSGTFTGVESRKLSVSFVKRFGADTIFVSGIASIGSSGVFGTFSNYTVELEGRLYIYDSLSDSLIVNSNYVVLASKSWFSGSGSFNFDITNLNVNISNLIDNKSYYIELKTRVVISFTGASSFGVTGEGLLRSDLIIKDSTNL